MSAGQPWHERHPDAARGAAGLYRNGFGLWEIASQLGVSPSTIHRALQAAGVNLRRNGRPRGRHARTTRRAKLAAARRMRGATVAEIAQELGVSRQYASVLWRMAEREEVQP